jgi:6-phosphogluconolactonase
MPSKKFPTLFVSFLLAFSVFHFRAIAAEEAANSTDAQNLSQSNCLVYVGTYTGQKSKGIYAFQMDVRDGSLSPLGLVGETRNPAFLDIDEQRKFLFAINEIGDFEGKPAGSVTSFSINAATGMLTQLGQRSSIGSGPCYVLLGPDGGNVLLANYGSGSVAVLPVEPDGHLGDSTAFVQHIGKSVNPARQQGPHAHCLTLDPANRFAFACDLGLDKILTYKFDSRHGTLVPNEPQFAAIKPGSGPRHIVFHPNGRQAYVISELKSTITRFAYDSNHGVLTEMQTISTVPDDFKGRNYPAEIAIHPSGAFLYGSNRGHDSIAIFAIDSATGALKPVGYEPTHGKYPRSFGIDPSGNYLLAANQNSDNLVVFRIDPATCRLKFTGQINDIPSPACIKFFTRR